VGVGGEVGGEERSGVGKRGWCWGYGGVNCMSFILILILILILIVLGYLSRLGLVAEWECIHTDWHRQTDRQAGRQTNRQTQASMQTDRQWGQTNLLGD
jgi:hypothetical protein